MNIQAKIDDIEYRINHGIPKFSSEDIFIIRVHSKFKIAFLKLFNQNEYIVDSNVDTYSELSSMVVTSIDRFALTKEEYESICLKLIKMYLLLKTI